MSSEDVQKTQANILHFAFFLTSILGFLLIGAFAAQGDDTEAKLEAVWNNTFKSGIDNVVDETMVNQLNFLSVICFYKRLKQFFFRFA